MMSKLIYQAYSIIVIYLRKKVWTSASVLQLAEGTQIVPKQTRCRDRQGTIKGQKPVEKEKQINHYCLLIKGNLTTY